MTIDWAAEIEPPQNAAGIANKVKGQNRLHWKCPARQNWHAAMLATRMFSMSEVGLIEAEGNENNVMTAM